MSVLCRRAFAAMVVLTVVAVCPIISFAEWQTCKGVTIWLPQDKDHTFTWTGSLDGNGKATGSGVLTIFERGDIASIYFGDMQTGKMDGKVVAVFPLSGKRYSGEIKNWIENGVGTMILADGTAKTGWWINGTFSKAIIPENKDHPNSPAPLQRTLNVSAHSIDIWKNYESIRDQTRRSKSNNDAAEELVALEKIDLSELDSIIGKQIAATKEYLKIVIAGAAKTKEATEKVRANREMVENARPLARKLGEALMPETGASEEMRQQTGKAIGDLILQYCYADQTTAKDLPDIISIIRLGDQVLTQESIINAGLGIENSSELKQWLLPVKDRAFASRLLSGTWKSEQKSGRVDSLKMSCNAQNFHEGGGSVEMTPISGQNTPTRNPRLRGGATRPRPVSKSLFNWRFVNGEFFMEEINIWSMMGNPQVRKLHAEFLNPGLFRISDENDKLIGEWERVER